MTVTGSGIFWLALEHFLIDRIGVVTGRLQQLAGLQPLFGFGQQAFRNRIFGNGRHFLQDRGGFLGPLLRRCVGLDGLGREQA